jgi:glycosyltransferase involved in cell wall biosynthesis
MNTVLLVTYMFPPLSGVGSIRPLKFARYLPEFGWQVIVLTVRKGFDFGSGMDASLLDQLPSTVHVHRARSVEPPYRVAATLAGGDPSQRPPVRKRFLRALRTAFLIPDDKIGWLPFAVREGRRIMRQGKVDLIFATSPPPTALLAAASLSRWGQRPLVVDFRDPWTQFTLHHWLRNPLRRRIEKALEHKVLRHAARIITVTGPRTAALAEEYPDIRRQRFVTLTNGFDLADFGPPSAPPHNERFTVVYTGSFYYHRQPAAFLRALEGLLDDHPDLRARVRVLIAGASGPVLGEQVAALGLHDVVTIAGIVPYRESVALQKGADVLLLFLGDSPMASTWYPAKAFEYIATGRPILALVPEGITADLVREAGTGVVIAADDIDAIRRAILDLFSRWREGRLPTLSDPAFPLRFERRRLTERLADLFNATLAEARTE